MSPVTLIDWHKEYRQSPPLRLEKRVAILDQIVKLACNAISLMTPTFAYFDRIHMAQCILPKQYMHRFHRQRKQTVRVSDEGKVVFRTVEEAANWELCIGADGSTLDDVRAYAIHGPARNIVDRVFFFAPPVVEIIGLRSQDEKGVDLVVKVLGNVNTQCIVNARMLINAMGGATVDAVQKVQKLWRRKRPLWKQLKAIHEAVRPELAAWNFDLSHHLQDTAEGVYARQIKRIIKNGHPLGSVPEYMDL